MHLTIYNVILVNNLTSARACIYHVYACTYIEILEINIDILLYLCLNILTTNYRPEITSQIAPEILKIHCSYLNRIYIVFGGIKFIFIRFQSVPKYILNKNTLMCLNFLFCLISSVVIQLVMTVIIRASVSGARLGN